MNTLPRSARIRIAPAVVAAGLALCSPSLLTAKVTTYNDETAYQIALLQLGHGMVREGFEDDATWGAVRTTIVDGAMTAASVTSQGVTWMHNFPASPGNRITTGSGAARTGDYGFFALPHGNYSSPAPCTVPGECGDGFTGSLPAGTSMFGVGGWISGSHGAKLGLFLDGATLSTGLNDETVTSAAKFFGVIDTTGFNKFEFRELEGKKEDQKFLWADDFTIGLTDEGCGTNTPPTAAFTLVASDPEVTFTDASSDTDGMIDQRLWDFGDGNSSTQQNPSHTYTSNGTYSVIIYVLDNDNCAAASPAQLISISSHPPTDVAITNPTNGATVSGTITLEVTVTDLPEDIEHVTYWQRSNDPALSFTHEVSSDLQIWNSGPTHTVLVSVIPVDAEIHQITFRGTGLGESDGRYFARVGVTGP